MSTQLIALLQPEVPTMGRLMALNMPGVDTAALVVQEIDYLEYRSVFLPEIKQCIPETIVAAVKSVIKQNLSLDPDAGLVYVTTRSVKIGGEWKKALEIKPSPDGKISIARMAGRLLDIKKPWVTYMPDGRVDTANIEIQVPAYDENRNPIARWETVTLGYTQFDRLRWFSHRDKSRNKELSAEDHARLSAANSLYTSWMGWIDPEFACAKVINAAMKRKGTNSAEKRLTILEGPQERFVSPEILKAMAEDGEEYTGYEIVNDTPSAETPAPVQPAAPVVSTPAAPVANNIPEKSPAEKQDAAIVMINNCDSTKAINDLWKLNKAEWEKDEVIKKAANEKKAALKNPGASPVQPASPVTPPPPPPPAPVAQTTEVGNPNYDFYRKVMQLGTADEIRNFYNENKDEVNKDNTLKTFLVDTGRELANNRPRPVCPIQLPGENEVAEVKTESEEDFNLI